MTKLTEELKLDFQRYDQNQLNKAFIDACKDGDLDVVQYLLTSSELQEHADIHADDGGGIMLACRNGHLDIIRYLLTSPELKEPPNIQHLLTGIMLACINDNLTIVEYLFTSPDLHCYSETVAKKGVFFGWACDAGSLNVVKYLLNSLNLGKIDIEDIKSGYVSACRNNRGKVIKYLLSLNTEHYINFQKTEYNLDWAMNNEFHNVVKSMIMSLYTNDRFAYIEHVSEVEKYCQKQELNFQKWQKAMMKNEASVNSHTTELFL